MTKLVLVKKETGPRKERGFSEGNHVDGGKWGTKLSSCLGGRGKGKPRKGAWGEEGKSVLIKRESGVVTFGFLGIRKRGEKPSTNTNFDKGKKKSTWQKRRRSDGAEAKIVTLRKFWR